VRCASSGPRLVRGYTQGITHLVDGDPTAQIEQPRMTTPHGKGAHHPWLEPAARQGRYSPTWNSELMQMTFGGEQCAPDNNHLQTKGPVVMQARDNRPPVRKLSSRDQRKHTKTIPECRKKFINQRELAASLTEPLREHFINRRIAEREEDQQLPWAAMGGHWWSGKNTMPAKRKLPVPGQAHRGPELGASIRGCTNFLGTTAVYAANGDCFSRHAFKKK